jgi:hypothetical protein
MPRTVASCNQCGDEREIAAHGLCFRCYRQRERKEHADLWNKPDRHATAMKKAQRRGRKALLTMINAVEDLEESAMISDETAAAIRRLIKPEVDRIGAALAEGQAEPDRHDGT